jgi:hypothetical protein
MKQRCPICNKHALNTNQQIYPILTNNESSDDVEQVWNNSSDINFNFSPTFFDKKIRQLVITNSTPIGQGSTARVFRAKELNGNTEYAVKLFGYNGLVAQGNTAWTDLHREIHLSTLAKGIPNICHPLGFAKLSGSPNGRPCLIYPYLSSTPSNLPYIEKNAKILKRTLQDLHKRGLVHGDMHYTWKNVCWTVNSTGQINTPYLIDLAWNKLNGRSLATACNADMRGLENMTLVLKYATSPLKYNLDKRLRNADDEECAEDMITQFLNKLAVIEIRDHLEITNRTGNYDEIGKNIHETFESSRD